MEVGDIVKGKPESDAVYSRANSKMTRGVVIKIDGNKILVRILEHEEGKEGFYTDDPDLFEVISHVKPFDRNEVLELLKKGNKKAMLEYKLNGANLGDVDLKSVDLSRADLSYADLSYTNLHGANLLGADLHNANLCFANLRGTNLRDANLHDAYLRCADLHGANLQGADLINADLDYACLPLKCGGLNWHIDKRIARQIAYHFCSMKCDDEEFIKMRNILLPFANEFHRVDECGVLEVVEEELEVKK